MPKSHDVAFDSSFCIYSNELYRSFHISATVQTSPSSNTTPQGATGTSQTAASVTSGVTLSTPLTTSVTQHSTLSVSTGAITTGTGATTTQGTTGTSQASTSVTGGVIPSTPLSHNWYKRNESIHFFWINYQFTINHFSRYFHLILFVLPEKPCPLNGFFQQKSRGKEHY